MQKCEVEPKGKKPKEAYQYQDKNKSFTCPQFAPKNHSKTGERLYSFPHRRCEAAWAPCLSAPPHISASSKACPAVSCTTRLPKAGSNSTTYSRSASPHLCKLACHSGHHAFYHKRIYGTREPWHDGALCQAYSGSQEESCKGACWRVFSIKAGKR